MNIFASLISTLVFGITCLFIANTFDPGEKYSLNALPIIFFCFIFFCLLISFFYFVYSLINILLKRQTTKAEIFRRGFLISMPIETLLILKILGLLQNPLIVIVIILIPIFIEWFYLETSKGLE